MSEVTTVTLAEQVATEEAACEAIVDQNFAPGAPLTGAQVAAIAAWANGTTYAKGALVTEGGHVYRSQDAANKEHKPSEDTDFAHWTPVSFSSYPLQNPDYFAGFTPTIQPARHEP